MTAPGLYDYWTDRRIGDATADQIASSDATLRWGGDGRIMVDRAGRVSAFGANVRVPPGYRSVFVQPEGVA